ncbi:MAG: DUF6259 domain-containing protein, partial [Phycisphaeraceae bacterium]
YEIEHDLGRGGSIVGATFRESDRRVDVRMADGFRDHVLRQDGEPRVIVRGGDGGLGAVIEVHTRFVAGNQPREAGPRAVYRYEYRADSPLVRAEATIPEQKASRQYHNLQLFGFEFTGDTPFKQTQRLYPAADDGRLMRGAADYPGAGRSEAGALLTGSDIACAIISPVSNSYTYSDERGIYVRTTNFIDEWLGERVELANVLYLGGADEADRQIALADGVHTAAQVSTLGARVESTREQIESRRDEAPTATGALIEMLLGAAQQRIAALRDLALAEALITEAEALLDTQTETDGVAVHTTDRFVALANEQTGLLFEQVDDRLALAGLFRHGHAFLMPTEVPRRLWHAWFRDHEQDGWLRLSAADGQARHEIERLNDGGARLTMRWSELAPEAGGVEARMSVALRPGDGLAWWDVTVQPRSDRLGLWELAYPVVRGVGPDHRSEAMDFLLALFKQGARLPNPRTAGLRTATFRTMPFHVYTQGGSGLYIGAHDPVGTPRKVQRLPAGSRGLLLSFINMVPGAGQPGTGYTLPFEMAMGTFAGNWYDGVQVYRERYMLEQAWFPDQPLHANSDVPAWLKRAVVAYRRSGVPIDSVMDQHEKLGEPPALLWGYWGYGDKPLRWRNEAMKRGHPSPGKARVPDIPRSAESFDEAVQTLQDRDVRVIFYLLANWWDYNSESWRAWDAQDAAVKHAGEQAWMHHRRSAGIMCHATTLYQDKMAEVVRQMMGDAAVDGTYFDLGGGLRPPFICFAENHGHPVGTGNFYFEGKREVLRRMREVGRAHNPDFALVTEGPGGGMFGSVQDGFAEFAGHTPVKNALWYDYLRPAGNKRIHTSMWPVTDDPHEALTPAKHFAWGSLIGRFGGAEFLTRTFPESERQVIPEAVEYYRRLTWHKYVARPWLNLGRMLRPLELTDVDPAATPPHFADLYVPSAVWRAPDGSVALVFANGWLSKDVTFSYTFDPAEYGLATDGSMALYRLAPAGDPPDVEPHYEQVEVIGPRVERREALPGGGVLVLVAQPKE